jgi:hypothetical protein
VLPRVELAAVGVPTGAPRGVEEAPAQGQRAIPSPASFRLTPHLPEAMVVNLGQRSAVLRRPAGSHQLPETRLQATSRRLVKEARLASEGREAVVVRLGKGPEGR